MSGKSIESIGDSLRDIRLQMPHRDYLGYLLMQAGVLLFSLPRGAVFDRLQTMTAPVTLLATVVAISASVTYYCIRSGGGELSSFDNPENNSRVSGYDFEGVVHFGRYLIIHLVQTVQLLMLSFPTLAIAYVVAGNHWQGLIWCLVAILVQATAYRLLGLLLTRWVGERKTLHYLALRVVMIVGYVGAGLQFSNLGYWGVATDLLKGQGSSQAGIPGGFYAFVLIHFLLCLCLVTLFLVIHQRVSRERR